jgi:hypothetical protein
MAAPGYFLCVISPTSALVKWLHANSSSFWERLRTAAESSRVCLDRASGTRCHPCRPLCRLHALFADGRIAEAGCWAHVRRKFFDVHAATGARIAKEALDRIGQFYGVEETINGMVPEQRRRERPIAEAFFTWMQQTLPKLSRKSELLELEACRGY